MADFSPNESLYRRNPFAHSLDQIVEKRRNIFENLFADQLSGRSPPQWDDPRVPKENGPVQYYTGHGADAAFNSAIREGAHGWERPYSFGSGAHILVPLANGKVRAVVLDDLGVPKYSTEMIQSPVGKEVSEDVSNGRVSTGRVYSGVLPSHTPTPDMTQIQQPRLPYSPSPGPSPVPMPMPQVVDPVQRQKQLRQLW